MGDLSLIIAEKPSVARDIAQVVGAKNKKEGYQEGNGYLVTWCFGHLIGYSTPDQYGAEYQKWSLSNLPIIPEVFKTAVIESSQKQFLIIKSLLNREGVTEIICATDAGREGELIFRLVYRQAECTKPFKRLWISSMTDEAIAAGLKELKNGEAYDRLYQSARCRAEADWLIGLNATRLFTVKHHLKLTVGRVQTPTLAMIVNRHWEIVNFQAEPFYQLKGNFAEGFSALWHDRKGRNKLKDQTAADTIKNKCQGQSGTIIKLETKEKSLERPQLYDLTELQRDANRRYGFTAQQVLDVAQSLYETHKLTTYPRTDSRYLTKDLTPTLGPIVAGVQRSNLFGFGSQAEQLQAKGLKIDKRIVDDSKVTDHHAIIPTNKLPGVNLAKLNDSEQKVLKLIVARFLVALAEKHVYDETVVTVEVAGELFKASGKKVKNPGWKGVEDLLLGKAEETERPTDADDGEQLFPQLEQGQSVFLDTVELLQKKTQPKKPFTEATLLSAMEHASDSVDEAELKESLKERGLGTPATRAAIIEKLIQVEYIERKGKKIQPTEKGIKCIELMPDRLKQPALTGEWEYRLNRIYKGAEPSEQFMADIKNYLRELVREYAGVREGAAFDGSGREIIGPCPDCGAHVYEGEKNYYCGGFKDGCKFGVFKSNHFLNRFGVAAVSKDLLHTLLTAEQHRATLRLETKNYLVTMAKSERGYYNLVFEKANPASPVLGPCPECGQNVIEGRKGFGCLGYKDSGCKFTLWKEDELLAKYGVTLTAAMVRDFLSKKRTTVQGLVDPGNRSRCDGQLELFKDSEGRWVVRMIKVEI